MYFYLKAYSCEGGNKDKELILDMALLYDEMGQLEKAKEKFKEIITLDPLEERAYYGMAIVYDNRGQFRKAVEFYKKAIEINPNYNRAYFFMAGAYDAIGKQDEAIEAYKKRVEDFKNPSIKVHWLILRKILWETPNYS